ncbi:ESPR-type extended signal peptide-containing protein [Snodgrassella alvi]|uniref:ESPR-type extended signal peptide-containing protein n=2 Tax=Snodgrassella alvi TaxID=1196083 RepID=UPI003512606A
MNKIYRAIWNETTQTWVAASELAKSKTKSDAVSSLPAKGIVSRKSRFSSIFKLSLIASVLNMSLLIPNSYASNSGLVGGKNVGSGGADQPNYPGEASHGTVIFTGSADACGADEVTGRGKPGRTIVGEEVSALEEYLRFATDQAFSGKNPYGTTNGSVSQTAAAQQGTSTGGNPNKLPVAYGVYSFASGCGSYTTGNYSTAFGTNATATAGGAMAIGTAALASGRASIAFGVSAQATGVSSVALGSVASSEGVGSVAAGLMSQASADGTVALGVQTQAKGHSAIAIGNSAQATGQQGISIGSANNVTGKASGAIGGSAATTLYNSKDGTQTKAASGATIVSGDNTYSFGNQNGTITADNTGIFGNQNTIETDPAGSDKANDIRILGNNNTVSANGTGAMIVGNAAKVSAANALALGNSTQISGANGVAIGYNANASIDDGVALGKDSVASTKKGVTGYDPVTGTQAKDVTSSAWNSKAGSVAVGNGSTVTRQITGLAAGTLDTDAVNVAQLKSVQSFVSSSLSTLTDSTSTSIFNLNSSLSSLNTSTSTYINNTEQNYQTLSTSVDNRFSIADTNYNNLSTATATNISILQEDALQWNSKAQAYDASHLGKGPAKILNVMAGDDSAPGSTDAVNGGQLYTTNSLLSSLSSTSIGSISSAIFKFETVSGSVSSVLSSTTEKFSQLSTATASSITQLNRDALQLKNGIYDASRDGQAQKITNIAAGDTSSATSTDVVNGGQLFNTKSDINSLSTMTSTSLKDADNKRIAVSQSVSNAIGITNKAISSLAISTSDSIAHLSDVTLQLKGDVYDASYAGTNRKVTNVAAADISKATSSDLVIGGQLYTTNKNLDNLTSTTAEQLSKAGSELTNISTGIDSNIKTVSKQLTDNINTTETDTTNKLNTVSTNLSNLQNSASTSIKDLRSNALQWENNAFSASRGNTPQKITQVAAGDITSSASTDAVNGSQLYTTNSNLTNLSTTFNTELGKLSDKINASSSDEIGKLSDMAKAINTQVTSLQNNALLWNDSTGAYDASHGGNPGRITNVLSGSIAQGSTDVITGGQLFSLSTATETKLQDVTKSLNTGLTNSKSQIEDVRKQALLWNQSKTAYDASNQQNGTEQKITGVAAGDISAPNSSDVVIGAQLYTTNSVLNSLSSSTLGNMNSLSTALDSTSKSMLDKFNSDVQSSQNDITALKNNALQWNSNVNAYDAKNQRITNVKDGDLGESSTDVVTGKQLYSISSSTELSLQSLSSSLDGLSATGLNKLSTTLSNGLSSVGSSIGGLKQDALQWKDGAYDASHGVINGTQRITNVKDGDLSGTSSDVVTGKQLFDTNNDVSNLSSSLTTKLQSLTSSTSSSLDALSTDLNKSLNAGLGSLSSAVDNRLTSTNASLNTLQKNALQWNGKAYDASHGVEGGKERITNVDDAVLLEGSSDVVTGGQLYNTNTTVSSLSTTLDRGIKSISTSTDTRLTALSDNLNKSLSSKINELSSTLDNGLNQADTSIRLLQKNALQWNGKAYDASHGVTGGQEVITNVADADLSSNSSDVVTGGQLFSTNSQLSDLSGTVDRSINSLSLSTSTGVSSLSTALYEAAGKQINSLSTSFDQQLTVAKASVTSLQQNALLWNNDLNNGKGAYDATHNGQAQRITNVLNGSVQASSSDVVTGDQLFTTNSNLGTLSGSVSTTFSSLSNSLSDINNDKLTELSGKLQSTNDELRKLSTTTSDSLKSTNTNLGLLQQNALLWNNELNNGKGAYDASHNGIYQRITNVADADLSPGSSDAVTGGQLSTTNAKVSNLSNTIGSVSNSVVNGLSSLSSSLTEISNNNLSSLSTGLNETRNRLTDLSESTSSSLKVTGSKIKSLQQNALLWNDDIDAYNAGHGIANMPGKITNVADGLIKEGSSDVATAGQLYTTNTAISSLSTNVSSGFDNLSTSLSTIAKAGGITSLSTVTETVSSKVTQLQQNALQYNNEPGVGGYDASRATGKPQKITRVAEGNISDTSSDVITGSQLYAVNTEYSAGLNSVSKSVSTGLTSVQDKLNSLSNDWPEKFNSLSNSASTGLGNLSTIVSTSISSLSVSTSGSVASLSTSTSTGLSSLSVSASNQIASLSTSTSSGLNNLSASTSTVLGKLGNTVSTAASNVAGLQKDALQWSEEAGAYSANHGTGKAQKITNVAAGNVAPDSSDAINGSQFFQLSSSTSTGLSSLSTNLSKVTNDQLSSLSTITGDNLNTVNQNVSSLSSGLNTVTEKVTALQKDALQWDKVNGNYKADHGTGNAQKITQVAAGSIMADSTDAVNGAQMYSLSTGTADSVNKLTENLNKTDLGLGSLSTATNTDLKNLKDSLKSTNDGLTQLSSSTSGSIQSISTSLDTLTTSTANSLQALDKGLKDTSSSVSTLQANTLQWNAGKGVYDASRDGSAKVLSGVAAGAVSAESTEAVNGGQLHSLSTVTVAGLNSISTGLSSLSESTTTGLNNLTNSLNSTNQTLTTLQANTLQWKGSAYDASYNGTAQRITNVAAGNIALDSTDAVNGGQLFSLSGSTSTGLSSLSTNLSAVTNNQLGSLSSIISNSLSTVNQNVSSLSSSLNDTNTNVAELRQNALQWNGVSSAYDATRSGRAQKLTGIAGGDISDTSSDAVNGAQMYSLSTLTQTGLGSISTGLSSLSSVTSSSLDNVNRSLESLSTETHTGLNSVSTGLSSLSESATTGLNNLSASLSSANQNLTTLQQNALQWNSTLTAYDAGHNGTAQRITNVAAGNIALDSTDAVNGGQLFSLSSSTSTGLSSLSTNLSKVTDNQLGSLSTIIGDNLNTVNQNVSSLSSSLNDTNTNVGNLQKDALQWNSTISAYDATRGGRAQTLTGIAGGDISDTSSDAVNGAQMYSLSTLTQTGLSSSSTGLSSLSSVTSSALNNVNRSLESLSTETHTGLNSVSTGLSSLSQSTTTGLNNLSASLSSANQNLTTLQQNALQWNSTLTAYDAGHNGIAQRITNVAAGRIAADSTDAVNGGQLFSLSGSTSTGLSSLSTVVSSTVINGINSISSSLSTGYESLSHSLSTATDNLQQLTNITSSSLSSLSTVTSTTQKDVSDLKEKALKWNDDKGGFDAGRPNNLTRDLGLGKIFNVEDGEIAAGSHEAVTGGQLYDIKSDLSALATSTSSSLSSLDEKVNGISTSNIITNITNLTKNALQWKDDGTGHNTGFYDASHNGTAQRITNIAAGNIAQGSLDAVNAGQLWTVQSSLSTLSTKVDTLPTGNISSDALTSLSTAISARTASQLASIAAGLGSSYDPNTGLSKPKYDSTTPTGGIASADNVADALQNVQNYGTKFAKINSAKAASVAQGTDSIAVGGAAMASGTSAVAIGDSASAPSANAVALGSQAKVTQTGGVALGAGSVANTAAGKEGYIPVTATSQQAAAIRATKSTEGAVSVGDASKGVYRQITGVAAGTADTDAVNVAQLKGVNNQITNVNKYVNKVNERVQRTERRAYSGTALAMALSGAYLPSLNAGEQAVGVGVGTYRGYTAVGANYKAISNSGNIGWGAGVSTTGKEVGFNAGVGFKWSNN